MLYHTPTARLTCRPSPKCGLGTRSPRSARAHPLGQGQAEMSAAILTTVVAFECSCEAATEGCAAAHA